MNAVNKNLLADFFNFGHIRTYEKQISDGFFEECNDVFDYIHRVVEIPISDFVDYIALFSRRQSIMAADVFQFSSFYDATVKVCDKIIEIGNPGLKFKEVAGLLLDDDVCRNDLALNKYGENHIKTAELLGLAFKGSNRLYYLSAIGCVFSKLTKEVQDRLLVRLIIRNKLISQMFILAVKAEFDLEAFLYDLSKSTYIRRRTNIRTVIGFLNQSQEYDFSSITKNIIFK